MTYSLSSSLNSHLYDLSPLAIFSSGSANVHIMPFANVFDVLRGIYTFKFDILTSTILQKRFVLLFAKNLRNGCVSSNSVLVHQRDQLTLLWSDETFLWIWHHLCSAIEEVPEDSQELSCIQWRCRSSWWRPSPPPLTARRWVGSHWDPSTSASRGWQS